MARQEIVPVVPLGTRADLYTGTAFHFTPTATDTVNNEQTDLPVGPRTLLIYHNTDGSPQNAEVKSVVNRNGRVGDQNFQLGAADAAVMGPFDRPGFLQTSVQGKLFMISSNNNLEVAAIQLPIS